MIIFLGQYCSDCFDYEDEDGCQQCQETDKKSNSFKDTSLSTKPNLADIRIVQKNLIYCIGLSPQISGNSSILKKPEYFGQYGTIQKIIIISSHNFNPPSNAAYITFSSEKEASLAILACESLIVHDLSIKSSFGTTKYCSNFLKGQQCPKIKECVYLHSHPRDKESRMLKKEEMSNNKWLFTSSLKVSIANIRKHLAEMVLLAQRQKASKIKTVFPSIDEILQRLIQQEDITQAEYDEALSRQIKKPKPVEPVEQNETNLAEELDRKVLDVINKMNAQGSKSRFAFTKNTQNKDERDPIYRLQKIVNEIK